MTLWRRTRIARTSLERGDMEIYDPTNDIRRFRDFRAPWVRIDHPERLLHGQRAQPIAFNATQQLVLLHMLDDTATYALSVFRSGSPDGPYGELLSSYENISQFDADA
jgi:hypothetical protein